jgi:hypothetical protein
MPCRPETDLCGALKPGTMQDSAVDRLFLWRIGLSCNEDEHDRQRE